MKIQDAIEAVLAEAGEPLHYREITRRMLEHGLWTTTGKTPADTVNARLAVDIKERSSASRFQRVARAIFALREWGLEEFSGKASRADSSNAPAKGACKVALAVDVSSESASIIGRMKIPVSAEYTETPSARAQRKALSFSDAADLVLDRLGGKRPMHYRAITEEALKLGLLQTQGRTPEATLYAQILTEIDRATKRGETPRFVKHGKGYVGLTRWSGHGLAYQIEQHNAEVRKSLRAQLLTIPPDDFEALIGRLLTSLGFVDVVVTTLSGDGGIDVRGTLVVGDVIQTRMAVQVKRWKANVQAPIVQQVRGSLGTHEQGLIIATSGFSSGARAEAERPNAVPVALMDGDQLVALLVEHSIGVRRESHDLIELGEGDE